MRWNHIAVLTTKGGWFEPYAKKLVKKNDLDRHQHNLVIHPSNLPQGKGRASLAWQILEGKNEIPIVMFEAVEAQR